MWTVFWKYRQEEIIGYCTTKTHLFILRSQLSSFWPKKSCHSKFTHHTHWIGHHETFHLSEDENKDEGISFWYDRSSKRCRIGGKVVFMKRKTTLKETYTYLFMDVGNPVFLYSWVVLRKCPLWKLMKKSEQLDFNFRTTNKIIFLNILYYHHHYHFQQCQQFLIMV